MDLPDLSINLERIDDPVTRSLQAEVNALGRPPAPLARNGRAEALERQRVWDLEHPHEVAKREQLLEAMAKRKAELERDSLAGAREKLWKERVAKWAGETAVLKIDSADPCDASRVAATWLASESWALVLFGGKGSSKSLSAARCGREVLRNDGSVRWVHCGDAALWRLWGPEAEERMRLAKEADMLVLDDVGADHATDVWRSWVNAVIDDRYRQQRRTVVTSNLARELLAERLGERVVSRLQEGEDSKAVWCFTGHVDYRRSKRRGA